MLLPTVGFLEADLPGIFGEPVEVLQVPAGFVGTPERLPTVAVENRRAVLDLSGPTAETRLSHLVLASFGSSRSLIQATLSWLEAASIGRITCIFGDAQSTQNYPVGNAREAARTTSATKKLKC